MSHSVFERLESGAGTCRPTNRKSLAEIEFRGPQLIVTVNDRNIQDVKVNELSGKARASAGLQQKAGRIGLESRSGHVEFRTIEIQELESAGGK